MDNYKIKVKDEAESKEAQELFFELGFHWKWSNKREFLRESISYLFTQEKDIYYGVSLTEFDKCEGKELTLPHLRDLVVLKRNDVKDANYRSTKVSDGLYFKTCDGKFYFMFEGTWVLSEINTDEGLEPITQDQGLISGADDAELVEQAKKFIKPDHLNRFEAAQAHLEGKQVQFMLSNGAFFDVTDDSTVGIFATDGGYSFRLKPQTIKLELEIPAPFEPKEGEECFIFDSEQEDGFYRFIYSENSGFHQNFIQFGVYRTEEEIKQVVEQLRKLRGNNS